MKYTIYIIKNEINNKVYIGYTSKNIDERFITNIKNAKKKINRRLYDSMNKYGHKKFTISVLDETEVIESAKELESWYIHIFNSKNSKYGYNMTNGGDGGYTLSEWTDTEKQNLYIQQKQNREKTLMDKYGVNSPSKLDSVKKKISDSHKGKKISETHKKNISTTIKEKIKKGEIIINTNGLKFGHIKGEFTHSDYTKEKISKTRQNKRYEDIFDEDTTKRLKNLHRMSFIGNKNTK